MATEALSIPDSLAHLKMGPQLEGANAELREKLARQLNKIGKEEGEQDPQNQKMMEGKPPEAIPFAGCELEDSDEEERDFSDSDADSEPLEYAMLEVAGSLGGEASGILDKVRRQHEKHQKLKEELAQARRASRAAGPGALTSNNKNKGTALGCDEEESTMELPGRPMGASASNSSEASATPEASTKAVASAAPAAVAALEASATAASLEVTQTGKAAECNHPAFGAEVPDAGHQEMSRTASAASHKEAQLEMPTTRPLPEEIQKAAQTAKESIASAVEVLAMDADDDLHHKDGRSEDEPEQEADVEECEDEYEDEEDELEEGVASKEAQSSTRPSSRWWLNVWLLPLWIVGLALLLAPPEGSTEAWPTFASEVLDTLVFHGEFGASESADPSSVEDLGNESAEEVHWSQQERIMEERLRRARSFAKRRGKWLQRAAQVAVVGIGAAAVACLFLALLCWRSLLGAVLAISAGGVLFILGLLAMDSVNLLQDHHLAHPIART
mmetsp:Transcript_84498/g.185476  ORF Transcript_84498/g.185476 Transcript_84498/m.185476 type:complete len:501 (-) Transcript_84498:49-1551(-)